VCGDSVDLIEDKPTGSVRVSFGFSSTLSDAQHFLKFVCECFLDVADNTVSSVADSIDTVSSSVSENVAASVTVSVTHGQYQLSADMMKPAAAAAAAGDDDEDGDDDANGEVCKDAAGRLLPVVADALQLVKMFIYPVKSCAAVQVNKPFTLTCLL